MKETTSNVITRSLRISLTAAMALIAAVSVYAGRFYESWAGWQKKYTGSKTMPADTIWGPDILPGYESRFIDMGKAFDGPTRCTLVRRLNKSGSKKAFLYVHGFNDYFFQADWGKEVVDSGYNFYAVDLRRYGRSRLPWQYPFNVRDFKEYFNDIDAALREIRRDGNTDITLGGHSTGGLTVCYYASCRGPRISVNRIVTDSPFLEWNYNAFLRNVAVPLVKGLSAIFPNAVIKQDHCDGYAYSLLKEYYGEWEYNTEWKMIYSPPVKWSWIGAVEAAQEGLMRNRSNISVPLLLMTSSRKVEGCNFTPELLTGDCVLDPAMIRKRGLKLGHHTTECMIDSGIHDLILSPLPHRTAARDSIIRFMRTTRRQHNQLNDKP